MKKKWRQALIAVLALVLLVSGGYLIYKMIDYQKGASDYESAVRVVEFPKLPESPPPAEEDPEEADPYAEALADMDLAALGALNDEVVGWIMIPGTGISYPLLSAEDNSYYLTHTWTGDRSSVGSIFLDAQSAADMSGFNTIIYGHRMRNGSMFGELKYYNTNSYWEEHPVVYIVNDSGVSRYRIFAAFEPSVRSIVYHLDLSETEDREEFIRFALERSVISTGVTPEAEDQFITLSTCTGRGYTTRWVVQAVLEKVFPAG